MIVAGLTLLAIGLTDIARPLAPRPRRWIPLVAVAVAVLALGFCAGSPVGAIIAVVAAAVWVWLVPVHRPVRAGIWPVVGLAVFVGASMAATGPRDDAGVLGALWQLRPIAGVSPDHVILVLGALVFLFESANVVVRIALAGEGVRIPTPGPPADDADAAGDEEPPAEESAGVDTAGVAPPDRALKGGRLIGPLERIIVFSLTLASAFTLLAAVLAAKGIVRFPEISRDDDTGNRAEYFLIGSLVSWVLALAAALLVWWGFTSG